MATKHLLFFLILLISSFTINNSQIEQQNLLQIKKEFRNPPSLSSWNISTPHCNWTGIQCTNSSVTEVNLQKFNITSPVPVIICNLKNLIKLDLSMNELTGPLLASLSNCTNLQYLDLSFNDLTGSFPTSLYNCTNLQYLDISANSFNGSIPSTINMLSDQLYYLKLSSNSFIGDIPYSIGQLSSLRYFLLENNLFNGTFPVELGNLSKLEYLVIGNNPFAPSHIPLDFGNMTSLSFLWMASMNLYGKIPAGLGKLQNLTMLSLNDNQLSGEIPAEIGLLPSLTDLSLSSNILRGNLPPELGKHSLLWDVEVDDNSLSGDLPHFLCSRGSLTSLSASNNNLTGKLPSSFENCHTLVNLIVHNNNLYGEVPAGLWSVAVNLTTVLMHHNSFSGELPKRLPMKLTTLDLSYNQLNGNIPESMGSSFNLQQDWLSGSRPSQIGSLTQSLKVIDFSYNQLYGEIPGKISLLRQLVWLDLSSNQLTGKIPTTIGLLSSLNTLKLESNQLSGPIPPEIGDLKLDYLNLSSNQLSGEFPGTISSLRHLVQLDLSNNQLTGNIPTTIRLLSDLSMLDLRNNQLSGPIPSGLGDLKLSLLNLSSNQLSGEIPALLDKMYSHSFLDNPNLCSWSKSLANIKYCNNSNNLSSGILIFLLVFSALFFLATATACLFLLGLRWRKRNSDETLTSSAWKLSTFNLVQFSESDIAGKLTDGNLIGSGGGGVVYCITLNEESGEMAAVKKIWNKMDEKLEKQFHAEIQILGLIRHVNIVKLYGCLSRSNLKLLIYEYIENGSLDQWLHRKNCRTLDWPTRLGIAIDIAKGLCYLHHDCSPAIVHRDVKSANILLDLQFKAKIADFGLARMLVSAGDHDSMSGIAGSFGYMAPECGWSRKVVLLELMTGRKASGEGDEGNLADWVWRNFQEADSVRDVIADEIKEESHIKKMEAVVNLGIICTGPQPASRPSMKEVLQVLLQTTCTPIKDDKVFL